MFETQVRQGKKRFYDNKKFSRGFAKSGDFTLAEENMLVTYGDTLLALESGQLTPENDDEKRFVEILTHHLEPQSKLEKVWLKYVNLARGRKRFHTLNGKNKPDAADDFVDDESGSLVEED
jgi:uncharacterized protein YifE (UPF0438 family)